MEAYSSSEKLQNWMVGNLYVASLDEYPPSQFLNYSSLKDEAGLYERWVFAVDFICRCMKVGVLEFSDECEEVGLDERINDLCNALRKYNPFDNEEMASLGGEYWMDTQIRASDYCRELLDENRKIENNGEYDNGKVVSCLMDLFEKKRIPWKR